jgi:hypothetical protein
VTFHLLCWGLIPPPDPFLCARLQLQRRIPLLANSHMLVEVVALELTTLLPVMFQQCQQLCLTLLCRCLLLAKHLPQLLHLLVLCMLQPCFTPLLLALLVQQHACLEILRVLPLQNNNVSALSLTELAHDQ